MIIAEEIERIVLEAYPNVSHSDIAKSIHYDWETIRKYFYQYYGISVNTFIRRVILSQTYQIWIDKGAPQINKKAAFAQIRNFRTKFIREFGFDIYYAQQKNINLRERTLNKMDPIEELNDVRRTGLIKNYTVEKDEVIIDFDQKMVLAILLEMGTAIYRKDLFQTDWYMKMPFESKCIFLLTLEKYASLIKMGYKENLKACLTEEEIVKSMDIFRNYNVDSPDFYGDAVVFHPVIPEAFENLFCKMINMLVGNIYFPFEDAFLYIDDSFEFVKIMGAFKYNSPINSINQLAKNSHMSYAKVKATLWKFTRLGLIRFSKATDIIRNGNG